MSQAKKVALAGQCINLVASRRPWCVTKGNRVNWGNSMDRLMVSCAAALLCAACAGERPLGEWAQPAALVAGVSYSAAPAEVEDQSLEHRSQAARMLAAASLERATGRQPDPARFAETR